MKDLLNLIACNPSFFAGAVKESADAVQTLEAALDVTLPVEVKWFWLSCGSGKSCAAPNAKSSIADTLRYRAAVHLPKRYIVLEDRNDSGSVFLDTDAGTVSWVNAHAVSSFAAGSALPSDQDHFSSFAVWLENCLEQVRD